VGFRTWGGKTEVHSFADGLLSSELAIIELVWSVVVVGRIMQKPLFCTIFWSTFSITMPHLHKNTNKKELPTSIKNKLYT
jgi:hypothetical protein